MGDQVYRLFAGEEIPVRPVGDLLTDGWLPGTWAVYTNPPAGNFDHALAAVDRSGGTGILAGFLLTGPQHRYPVEELSDMWTTDTRQRAGGDTKQDWGPSNAGGVMEIDDDGLVQRLSADVVTLVIAPTGFHKFYVYETQTKAARHGGAPASLSYATNSQLYVSENGLLTSEQETAAHPWTGYVVASSGSDAEGGFIVACAAMA